MCHYDVEGLQGKAFRVKTLQICSEIIEVDLINFRDVENKISCIQDFRRQCLLSFRKQSECNDKLLA